MTIDTLIGKVREHLDGIDRTQDDDRGGYWQTQDGAQTGKIILRNLEKTLRENWPAPAPPLNGITVEELCSVLDRHDFRHLTNPSLAFALMQHPVVGPLLRQRKPAPLVSTQATDPLPTPTHVGFEFEVRDADYCVQATGSAPTYAQALREGRHYLGQYLQDGPHTLEIRRVETFDPDDVIPAVALDEEKLQP